MKNLLNQEQIRNFFLLLRWNKPSGRLILLIPAGWSLWLAPSGPPSRSLTLTILLGGICISGAGCIANDLWDKRFDQKVSRTKERPLAKGLIKDSTAFLLLLAMLFLSFIITLFIPIENRNLCLKLACSALPLILIYPSAKRWFPLPQLILAICWGFSVLIPWAAIEGSITPNISLYCCWFATVFWTFGFDTIYAMADQKDDKKLSLKSSAITLNSNAINTVSICYLITSLLLMFSAINANINGIFWPFLLIASIGMNRETRLLKVLNGDISISMSSKHFRNQVLLGGLILCGLIVDKLT